jgi:hypothetical protein
MVINTRLRSIPWAIAAGGKKELARSTMAILDSRLNCPKIVISNPVFPDEEEPVISSILPEGMPWGTRLERASIVILGLNPLV